LIFLYDRMSIGKMKICVYSNTAKAPEFAPLGLLSVVERGLVLGLATSFYFLSSHLKMYAISQQYDVMNKLGYTVNGHCTAEIIMLK
jgi:hypothetical protein